MFDMSLSSADDSVSFTLSVQTHYPNFYDLIALWRISKIFVFERSLQFV